MRELDFPSLRTLSLFRDIDGVILKELLSVALLKRFQKREAVIKEGASKPMPQHTADVRFGSFATVFPRVAMTAKTVAMPPIATSRNFLQFGSDGPQADVPPLNRDVRCTLESGHLSGQPRRGSETKLERTACGLNLEGDAMRVIAIVAATLWVIAATGGILKEEPKEGQLHPWQRVLVDDGTCPSGQVKEVTGGDNRKYKTGGRRSGSERSVRCVSR